METIFNIIQVVAAILLMITILMQQKGTGLGSAFGGGAEVYSSKRGAEKVLFRTTIVLTVIFLGVGLVRLVLGV